MKVFLPLSALVQAFGLARGARALAVCAALAAAGALAQSGEAELKVAFLYNFLKLADWPESEDSATMDLCLAHRNPFGETATVLEGRQAQRLPLRVRVVENLDALQGCRLLFVAEDEKAGAAQRWLEAAEGSPILTVSDRPEFIDRGGMIGLTVQDNRLRFEVNLEPVLRNRLRLSSQLLQLASRVKGKP